MKKILYSTTAVAAALAGILILIPGQAQGATAKEKFVAMRSALAKAARDGELTISAVTTKQGLASFSILLDGSPLPSDVPVTTTSKEHGDFVDYAIRIDLSDGSFSSIQYGKDQNTLNLVPKAKPGNLDVVRLDPKSSKPIDWSTFATKQGSLRKLSSQTFSSSTSSSSASKSSNPAAANPFDGVITVEMRIGKSNGSATVTVKKDQ